MYNGERGVKQESEMAIQSFDGAYHEKCPCRVIEKDCSRYNEHC